MIILGITGSIGMGKTTVSKMLRILKIPVFDSDKTVKVMLEENLDVIEKISMIWPETVSSCQTQKKVNKLLLSDIIFKNTNEREKLEKIIHPIVNEERKLFLKRCKKNKIVGLDIPLLYETGMDNNCDYIFLINTTKRVQMKRVLNRPNMTEKKFELINNSQWSLEKKIKGKKKPYIITTSFGIIFTFIIVLFYLFQIKFKGIYRD